MGKLSLAPTFRTKPEFLHINQRKSCGLFFFHGEKQNYFIFGWLVGCWAALVARYGYCTVQLIKGKYGDYKI